jgi:hypothetical protein
VYLHLTDAGAVNALLECLVLEVPVIVNPIPAVVELFGQSYPLYADNEDDAATLLKRDDSRVLLMNAVDHLRHLDLSRFEVRHLLHILGTCVWRYEHETKMCEVLHQLLCSPPSRSLKKGGTLFRAQYRLLSRSAAMHAKGRRQLWREDDFVESYFHL